MTDKPLFGHKSLLGISQLSRSDIDLLLEESEKWANHNQKVRKSVGDLFGLTVISAFFENSTRTSLSFGIAAQRLGADVVSMTAIGSSVNKGETLIDTAATLAAMKADVIVIRHASSGAVALIADKVNNCPVINAGDGQHEHPTQAILDALTIKERKRTFSNLKVSICGDILHSRVARSNIMCLNKLGAEVHVIGPATLMPYGIEQYGVRVHTNMDEGLKNSDVVMMLRLQTERMTGAYIPSLREYHHLYGLTADRIRRLCPEAFVMHPGPMNRGVEIDSIVADNSARSLIEQQVEMGVAVRMACLELLTRSRRPVDNDGPSDNA